jgi:hypothetical protein
LNESNEALVTMSVMEVFDFIEVARLARLALARGGGVVVVVVVYLLNDNGGGGESVSLPQIIVDDLMKLNPKAKINSITVAKEVERLNGGAKKGLACSSIQKYWALKRYLSKECKYFIRMIINGGIDWAFEEMFGEFYDEQAFWTTLEPKKRKKKARDQSWQPSMPLHDQQHLSWYLHEGRYRRYQDGSRNRTYSLMFLFVLSMS